MLTKMLSGGIYPPALKKTTSTKPTKVANLPKRAVIPLIQHIGAPCKAKVKVGDYVKKGELIAEADTFITSPIHSSISGIVKEIEKWPHPTIGEWEAIVIEGDGKDTADENMTPRNNADSLSREDMLDIIKKSGIVGLGGAVFPTYVKLSPPKNKKIDFVILNGAECEPYLTCDYRLMFEKPKEILKGLEVILRILGAKNAYIAIEGNKLDIIQNIQNAVKQIGGLKIEGKDVDVKIAKLPTKYPQGAEKQVIKSVLNRIVPAGSLPLDVGCLVHNVGTSFAIYEAIYFGKPLIERCLTIAGPCIKEPVNLWVRIGTLLKDLEKEFGGFIKEPKKIIVGGPMMGIAQYTDKIPITKNINGVLFLSGDDIDESRESVCIRCGECIEACPMELVPTALMYRVKKKRFIEAKELGIMHCFECGACAYACPAKIPLLDYIKLGKSKIVNK